MTNEPGEWVEDECAMQFYNDRIGEHQTFGIRCGRCFYWEPDKPTLENQGDPDVCLESPPWHGKCHRYPALRKTEEKDWCGEFRQSAAVYDDF